MYAWIWEHLPGPRWARILLAVALAGLVVAALFGWVFPWLESVLRINDVTVSASPLALGAHRSLDECPRLDCLQEHVIDHLDEDHGGDGHLDGPA